MIHYEYGPKVAIPEPGMLGPEGETRGKSSISVVDEEEKTAE
jgi:hypothetical protein